MSAPQTALLVGGTGRTGQRVPEQLLSRGASVRAIVRSARKLPAGAAEHPNLAVVEADLLSLGDEELRRHVLGCDAVISCLVNHPGGRDTQWGACGCSAVWSPRRGTINKPRTSSMARSG